MGRKPISDKAMTPAERQRRRRERLKAAEPPRQTEQAFRRELWQFIEARRFYYPELTAERICHALDEFGQAMSLDEWLRENGKDAWHVAAFLQATNEKLQDAADNRERAKAKSQRDSEQYQRRMKEWCDRTGGDAMDYLAEVIRNASP